MKVKKKTAQKKTAPSKKSPVKKTPSRKSASVKSKAQRAVPGKDDPAMVIKVKTHEIVPSPLNPRKHFSEVKLAELAQSIRDHGIQQPVQCRRRDGKLELVFGERRWRASCMIQEALKREGRKSIDVPVIVVESSDETVLEVQMIENVQRDDLTPLEKAGGYKRMMDYGSSVREVAEKLKVSIGEVSTFVRLLDIPKAWQKKIDNGMVPLYVAKEAMKVKDKTQLDEALQLAADSASSVDAAKRVRDRYIRPTEEKRKWTGMKGDLRNEHGTEITIMSYEESREIFPLDVSVLQGIGNAKKWGLAESQPESDLMVGGKESPQTWFEYAQKFDAPIAIACDGVMLPRMLVRRDLVLEAAKLAHADSPELNPFKVYDVAGKTAQQMATKREGLENDKADADKYARASEMIGELRMAIESPESRKVGEHLYEHELLAAEAKAFLHTSAILGFTGMDYPVSQVLVALDLAPKGSEHPLSNWEGAQKNRWAADAIAICAWCWHFLEDHEGDELLESAAWSRVVRVYGLRS